MSPDANAAAILQATGVGELHSSTVFTASGRKPES